MEWLCDEGMGRGAYGFVRVWNGQVEIVDRVGRVCQPEQGVRRGCNKVCILWLLTFACADHFAQRKRRRVHTHVCTERIRPVRLHITRYTHYILLYISHQDQIEYLAIVNNCVYTIFTILVRYSIQCLQLFGDNLITNMSIHAVPILGRAQIRYRILNLDLLPKRTRKIVKNQSLTMHFLMPL